MTHVSFGNHTATLVARADQSAVRAFYIDALGAVPLVTNDDVDRYQLGDMHFCFVWKDEAPPAQTRLGGIWLELRSDDPAETARRAFAAGATRLDVPDPHVYLQAPGGQPFRIVGTDEDLSLYETSPASNPAAAGFAAR